MAICKYTFLVCSRCYADNKNFYSYPNSKIAQVRRLVSLWDPLWVETISELIERKSEKSSIDGKFFRWHDSGDILGRWHLDKMIKVAQLLPKISFWLPTREVKVVEEYQKSITSWSFDHPDNLVIRVSSHRVSQEPLNGYKTTSTVHLKGTFDKATLKHECPAPTQDNQCGTCRACWKKDVLNVSYKLH